MNQILIAICKAVLITLVTTATAIAVDKIRSHNEDERDPYYYEQPNYDEHEYW